MRLLVATRSLHKFREIEQLLGNREGIELLDPDRAAIQPTPVEDGIEVFDTFTSNALAKARYFSRMSGLPVLADDSGICVDALDGAPGVRSRRFAADAGILADDPDRANNEHLLRLLREVPDSARTAHYECVIAIVLPNGAEHTFTGQVEGVVLRRPRGAGGFGYDPLFLVPDLGLTFAELSPDRKNDLSHRARAIEKAVPLLRHLAASRMMGAERPAK